ncbi:MAG: hypothetical protein AB7O57_17550 [Hyphomicrobiaceae bacterium]
MAESQSRLEVTPKVVDLGDKVIQLHHVVSAGRETTHPLRLLGLVVLLVGTALPLSEVVTKGLAAFALKGGGSLPLWIGFALIGIGLFLVLFARRQLIVRTSDGARITLPAATEEAAAALVLKIKHAMEMAGPPFPSSGMPHAAATAQALPAADLPALAPRTGAPIGLPHQGAAPMTRGHPTAEISQPHTGPVTRPYANGHAPRTGFTVPEGQQGLDAAAVARLRSGAAHLPAHAHQPPLQIGHPGDVRASPVAETMQPAIAREPVALPATSPTGPPREDPARDLAALIDHVRRADVQHKEALLDLLRVVDDYYRGRAGREDAIAHWRSFADYVVQYLGDVDGLIAHTERFGRHMLVR